jgi:hypothetical protein
VAAGVSLEPGLPHKGRPGSFCCAEILLLPPRGFYKVALMEPAPEKAVGIVIRENFVARRARSTAIWLAVIYVLLMGSMVFAWFHIKDLSLIAVVLTGVFLAAVMAGASWHTFRNLSRTPGALTGTRFIYDHAQGCAEMAYGPEDPLTLDCSPNGRWWILTTPSRPKRRMRILVAAFPHLRLFLLEQCPHFVSNGAPDAEGIQWARGGPKVGGP